jgi:hypothetical protein
MSKIIADESPEVLFNKLMQDALAKARINISENAIIYVTHMLVVQALNKKSANTILVPLAPAYLFTMTEDVNKTEREKNLRDIGDAALLLTGFWWQYIFTNKNPKYHIALGRKAYSHIQREPFPELATKFEKLVSLLMEISSRSRKFTNKDILKLYTAWSETQNAFFARLLAELGVTPMPPGKLKN